MQCRVLAHWWFQTMELHRIHIFLLRYKVTWSFVVAFVSIPSFRAPLAFPATVPCSHLTISSLSPAISYVLPKFHASYLLLLAGWAQILQSAARKFLSRTKLEGYIMLCFLWTRNIEATGNEASICILSRLARHILPWPYFTVKSWAVLVTLYVYCALLTVVTCAMCRLLWPLIHVGHAGWLERRCDFNKIGFWDACTPF